MKPNGRFVIKGAALTVLETSFYDSHMGAADTNIYDFVFDSYTKLKVKSSFTVNLDRIDVKDEDEQGQLTITTEGNGTLKTFGEDQEVIFEGAWQAEDDHLIKIYNNLITELKIPVVYSGEGMNSYSGHLISGKMTLELTGFDESGMGIYEINGDGTIQ